MTIVTKALAIGQKTMWSNWIRYSHALWLRGCSSCPYVDDFWQDNHSKTIYVKQLALTEKNVLCPCSLFFSPQKLILSKVTSFRKTKIVDWHRSVNVSDVMFICLCCSYWLIICLLLSQSDVKSLLSIISTAKFVKFL